MEIPPASSSKTHRAITYTTVEQHGVKLSPMPPTWMTTTASTTQPPATIQKSLTLKPSSSIATMSGRSPSKNPKRILGSNALEKQDVHLLKT